ncbi:MAG TPA: DUF6174 domain-containing protein [Gemmatimonadota bacterium]|nr:DUF6174 domain-containing protein [Gemmatimonadota bacterium]
MTARPSFTPLAVLLLAVACSLSGPGDEGDPLARLEASRAKWVANGPSEYELAMRRSCGECLPEGALAVVVSVSSGGTTVSLAQNGERIENQSGLYPDVDGLFELIEIHILAGADVEAEYDGDLGFPRSVSIDPVPDAVDDEFGYVVDDLAAGRLVALRAELRVRRERWAGQRILDYQLTLSRSCFCSPEGAGLVVLTVLEGEPAEWQYFLSGDPIAPEWRAFFPTVEGLFDFVEDAIDRGAESIEVRYDEDLGLPTTIRVDYRLAAVDEEIAYEVEKLLDLGRGAEPTPARKGE